MQAPTEEIAEVYLVFGPHREPNTFTPRYEIVLRSHDTARFQCLLQVLSLSGVLGEQEALDQSHLFSQPQ